MKRIRIKVIHLLRSSRRWS